MALQLQKNYYQPAEYKGTTGLLKYPAAQGEYDSSFKGAFDRWQSGAGSGYEVLGGLLAHALPAAWKGGKKLAMNYAQNKGWIDRTAPEVAPPVKELAMARPETPTSIPEDRGFGYDDLEMLGDEQFDPGFMNVAAVGKFTEAPPPLLTSEGPTYESSPTTGRLENPISAGSVYQPYGLDRTTGRYRQVMQH